MKRSAEAQLSKETKNMICSALRTIILLLLGICGAMPCGLAAQATTPTTGHLQGTVFSGVSDQPVCASGVKVTLYGDIGIFSTVTDQDGKFAFTNILPPGIYFIEANHLGLQAAQNVKVHAGAVVQVSLHLKVPNPNKSTNQ